MTFDVGFKKLDLIVLQFNDTFNHVTNRYNANYFVGFKNGQVSNVLVNHDGHALVQCVREFHG